MTVKIKPIKGKEDKNPYNLIYWDSKMSQKQVDENNLKFWNWEYINGNLK